jgi:hypothetical protein
MAASRLANNSGAISSGAGSVTSTYTQPSRIEVGYVRMFSPPNRHVPSVIRNFQLCHAQVSTSPRMSPSFSAYPSWGHRLSAAYTPARVRNSAIRLSP